MCFYAYSARYRKDTRTVTQTVLKYGEPERFRVSYREALGRASTIHESTNLREDFVNFNLREDLVNFTDSKALSWEEARLIKEVEVWCKADFLNKYEIEIIDTPAFNTLKFEMGEVAYRLPSEVDAIMFLLPSYLYGISAVDQLFLSYAYKYGKRIVK